MQIIPVIDLLGGVVVHGQAGNRARYLPIQSKLTLASDLVSVISDLLSWHLFPIIYIADLDAIERQKLELNTYYELEKMFPRVEFWLDVGIEHAQDIKSLTGLQNTSVVLGTETLKDKNLVKAHNKVILSLDYKDGDLLGLSTIVQQPEQWPKKVIVINLNAVGMANGPDFELLKKIQTKSGACQVFAAGGVRDIIDLRQLAEQGIKGVLVASALHNGSIDKKALTEF